MGSFREFDDWLEARCNHQVDTAVELASEIERLLPDVHKGTLQFWGIWFGRPYDNRHVIAAAHAEGDCLVLKFDQNERLLVWHPRSAQVSVSEFSIYNASRVRWEWYFYGRPETPGNLMVYDFEFNGGDIKFSSTVPGEVLQKPNPHAAAVKIH